jgi:flavin-dependent dehydrogenase
VRSGGQVVILGGGPAGCATALSLLGEGVDPDALLVVEADHFERTRVGESVPPDTRSTLAALGVFEGFLQQGHEPSLGSASSWGAEELGYNDFLFNPQGCGWHLDRQRFDAWLAAEVEARGVELKRGFRFTDVIDSGDRGVEVVLRRGGELCQRVSTRFVVDATGSRGVFARRMGARRRELDRLVSVAAFMHLRESSAFARLTFLEAVEYGWWYTARLPDHRVATAVTTSPGLYQSHHFNQPRVWLEHLSGTRHIAQVLSDCTPIDNSYSVHLAPSFVLDRVHGDHWIAVGDAASAYDPLSSQGIYKALHGGLHAGRALWSHLHHPERGALQDYQAAIEAQFVQYAEQRGYFYRREQRWKEAPFWRERQLTDLRESSDRPHGAGPPLW